MKDTAINTEAAEAAERESLCELCVFSVERWER